MKILLLLATALIVASCGRAEDDAAPDQGATQVQPPPEPPGMQQPSYPDRGIDTLPGSGGLPGAGTDTGAAGSRGTTGAGTGSGNGAGGSGGAGTGD